MYLTPEQHDYLMKPLRGARIAKRKQGGKELSYLEAWDVKAHLTRIFGFGNWDSEVTHQDFMGSFPYEGRDKKEMVEIVWQVTLRLTIWTRRPDDANGWPESTVYSEAAVGSATGSGTSSGIGDLHDNAIKTAASDALKRCAINLGTQFGLSLYDNGSTSDVVKVVLAGDTRKKPAPDPEKEAALAKTVGAVSKTVPDAEGGTR